MKKIYLLLLSVVTAGSAIAQYQPLVREKVQDNRMQTTVQQDAADREVFWTNDFSDCSDWMIDNAFDNGYDQFVEGLNFECGDVEPEGPAAIAALNSTTSSNGIMMVDSDEFGGEEGGDGIENCWFQTVEPIDCSGHEFVSISFETYYRMWDNGSSDGNEYCLVEVSTDGVTWPDVETFEESDAPGMRYELWPEMQTQDPVANPTIKTFDITAAAGGQEQVWLRFRWKGTWGYAWMVDDVQLYDTPANDVRVDSYATYTDYLGTNMYEYSVWPQSQVTEVQMAAKVANAGYNPQTGVGLQVNVNGSDIGTSDLVELPYQGTDTLRMMGYTIPSDLGTYDIEMNIVTDSIDENMGDNMAMQSFEVSEYVFGRDDMTYTGVFPTDGTDEFIAATPFQFFADATVYAIQVAIMDGSDAGTDIIAHILDENLEILYSSSELQLNPDFTNAGDDGDVTWYTLTLEDPYDAVAGELVTAAFEHYGGSNVQIGESIYTDDNTAFVYGDFGTAGFDWYYTNDIPMVRLSLDPAAEDTPVSVDEQASVNFNLFQNNPNPATDVTRIRYNLNQANTVSLQVHDITGKLVFNQYYGTQGAGANNIELNVNDFGAGMYTYTLIVGGEQVTRKMMVK